MPPSLDIVEEDMHHSVFGPFLDVKALKKKSVRSEAEFGECVAEPMRMEADRLIEAQAGFEILGGKERTKGSDSWNESVD